MCVTKLDAEFLRAQIEHSSSIGDIIIIIKSVVVFPSYDFPDGGRPTPSVSGKYYLARFLPENTRK